MQKMPEIRDKKYLKYLQTKRCLVRNDKGQHCNRPPIAHHCTFIRRAMSKKADDCWCLPLCWKCHSELHRMGERGFWALYGYQEEEVLEIAERLWREYENRS